MYIQHFLFEACLFAFLACALMLQNWNVYHSNFPHNCNFSVLLASLLLLGGRLFGAQFRLLKAQNPHEIHPEQVALWVVVVSHVAGTGAWLARNIIETNRVSIVCIFLGAPVVVWVLWRFYFYGRLHYEQFGHQDSRDGDVGKHARRCLRIVFLEISLVLEQSLFSGFVVAVLPPAFKTDPNLYFDRWDCVALGVSVTISTTTILFLWTLRTGFSRLRTLWVVLGDWRLLANEDEDEEDDEVDQVKEWDCTKIYAKNSVVTFNGQTWIAVGPYESNLARPGSKSAYWLHFWIGVNVLRPFDVLICIELALTVFHAISAFVKSHFVCDVLMMLLNCPIIIAFLLARRNCLEELSKDAGSQEIEDASDSEVVAGENETKEEEDQEEEDEEEEDQTHQS